MKNGRIVLNTLNGIRQKKRPTSKKPKPKDTNHSTKAEQEVGNSKKRKISETVSSDSNTLSPDLNLQLSSESDSEIEILTS